MFTITLAFPLLNGLQNIYLYRSLGADISNQDGVFITAASTLANQLPIPGGIISKGVYLKRRYNLTYTRFISSTVATFFLFIAVNGFIGVAILLFWFFFNKAAVSPVLLIAFTVMVACLLVFWLPLDRIRMPEKIHRLFRQALEGWMLISTNPVLLLQLVVLQAILSVLLALRYWLAFRMLSQQVTMAQTLLFACASILTQLVSIAPGGLGAREAIVGAVALALGFDAGTSVVAVGLDRLVSTITILLIGGISTVILGKRISDLSVKTIEQKKTGVKQ
jgi:uncharacterized membrane protein YbhN (UPF0104 family)